MNGLKSSQLGIQIGFPERSSISSIALLRLDAANLLDRRIDVRDREAVLVLDHNAALRGRRAVGVVRDVQRSVAVIPRLAKDVSLEPLHVLERLVDALGRV